MEPKIGEFMHEENMTDQEEGLELEDEYKNWKINAPYLYDVLITWGLDWPSLCINWIPKVEYFKNSSNYIQNLVLGTHTSGQEADYLMVGKVLLPISKVVLEKNPPNNLEKEDLDYLNSLKNEEMIENYSKYDKKFEIEIKIRHEGEVNKAKASPHESNLIATQTNKGEIHIFNYYNYPKEPKDDIIPEPTKKLKYHTKLGYALSWSNFEKNYLLSGSYDGSVCIWDINSKNSEPLYKFNEHKSECEDVCFNKKQNYIFGTCGDDKKINIFDYRVENPVFSVVGHEQEINSLDFNPHNEFLYITGSNDKTVALWDLRKPDLKLHSFSHHKNNILNVKWNNNRKNIFASSGEDNKILIWDLSQIGANIARDDNEEAPSEMIFEHGGHLDKINDMDWNQNEDMMCASVDDNNNLQIWEMNVQSIINKDI